MLVIQYFYSPSQEQLFDLRIGHFAALHLLDLLRHQGCGALHLQQGLGRTEKLSLFVTRVFLAADVDLLVVLGDLAALAHAFDTGTHLHPTSTNYYTAAEAQEPDRQSLLRLVV